MRKLFNWLDMRGGKTRTTRTPAFWDTAPWLPILVIHIRSQVKTRQSQSYQLKKIANNPNFEILQETLHATHLLKLLDKMSKYEMDPTRTVGSTEWTRNAGRTDGRTDERTDRWTDGRSETNIPPNNLFCAEGIIIFLQETHSTEETETLWKTHLSGLVFMSHGTSTSNSRGSCILIHKWVSFELHRCIRDPYGRFVIIGTLCGYAIQSGRHPVGSQRLPGRPQVDPGRWLPEGCLPDLIA